MNNAQALLSAALDGFGVALIADDLARDALEAGALIRVLAAYEAPSRPMHLLYAADRRQTTKVKSFVDATVERFGRTGA